MHESVSHSGAGQLHIDLGSKKNDIQAICCCPQGCKSPLTESCHFTWQEFGENTAQQLEQQCAVPIVLLQDLLNLDASPAWQELGFHSVAMFCLAKS